MKQVMIDLVAYLKGDAGFTALFGSGAECRLYAGVANEGSVPPYVVYALGRAPFSKDGYEYRAVLQVFYGPNDFTGLVEATDACAEILAEKYEVGLIDTDYSNDAWQHFSTIQFTID